MHVRWAYQLKLRDRGTYGFLLPKEHIIPTGKEMVDAIMYFGEFLQEAYLMKGKAAISENDEQSSALQQEAEENIEEASRVSEDQAEIDSTLSGKASQILVEDLESETKWDLRKRRAR
jgi:extracellular matrix protein 14